jgi:hypothetical protein
MRKGGYFPVLVAIFLIALLAVAMGAGCGSKQAKPELTNLDPSAGPPGTQVSIIGTNFGDAQGNSVVHVGVKVADVVSWSNVLVTFKVPTGLTESLVPVSILTSAGESNELTFGVQSSKSPSQPSGDIESVTPVTAMKAYEKQKGVSTAGWTFSVVKLSAVDSNWKIDKGGKASGTTTYFLLHNVPTAKVNPNWTVIDAATSFTPQKLASDGAPSDLQIQLPPPTPPQPPQKTQEEVILDYIKAKGVDTSAVTITLVNESKIDPTWELFNADWPAQAQIPDAQIVLHKENGQWVVKNYGSDVSNTPGMPNDLVQLPQ